MWFSQTVLFILNKKRWICFGLVTKRWNAKQQLHLSISLGGGLMTCYSWLVLTGVISSSRGITRTNYLTRRTKQAFIFSSFSESTANHSSHHQVPDKVWLPVRKKIWDPLMESEMQEQKNGRKDWLLSPLRAVCDCSFPPDNGNGSHGWL